MRVIRNILWFVSFAAIIVAGFAFFSQNLKPVTVEFMYWSTRSAPLALALFISCSIGVLAAGLCFLFEVLRLRMRLRKSRRMCELLERELDALRNAPLYDELPSTPATTSSAFDQHLTHEGQPERSS